ncbi:MAG: YicC/YloC family endoribonuclease [Bacteroidota bacterium]
MIRSMTGWGKAEAKTTRMTVTVEIRALNSKGADISTKMPPLFRDRELEIRNEISGRLNRGKIDLFVNHEYMGEEAPAEINKHVFKNYAEQLKEACRQNGISENEGMIQAILRLPEVVKTTGDTISEEEWASVLEAIDNAITEVDKFRMQEGKAMESDINNRLNTIQELLASVDQYEENRIEKIRSRLQGNLKELINIDKIDENRFEQELIYYMEKIDINEEKVRLGNHINYFRELMQESEVIGKKLGFVSQELGREINTLGSKANDSDIQKLVINMKDELEKIKELTLNIL